MTALPRSPEDDAETLALLKLIAAGGSSAARCSLIERFGGAAAALAAGPAAWRDAGWPEDHVAALSAATPPPAALAWLRDPSHHLIGWHRDDYPPLLRKSPSPPLALFVAGDPSLLWQPAVAVVGSRGPTPGGRDNARDFARAFAATGLVVGSGMAAGIDTAAHLATLEAGGRTLAVLGTGPDVPYPRANSGLHARIAGPDGGAIVSEYLPGTGPVAFHFPSRNRILAGLTVATVVIEAAERSGALITARLAAEAGREVFAVPGSIHNPLARGCHRLIRDGAGLVASAQEVIDALAPQVVTLTKDLRRQLGAPIQPAQAIEASARGAGGAHDPDYQTLWDALGHDPTAMDQLVQRTGLTAAAVSSMLLLMELDGRVFSQHGRYSRCR
ncbi:DNA-processing protein DprA [Lysobacter arvi]|uniref:DNA-processing protein DprA n=1 Tax=Lysobacter arvi TaxID=3038776 RepID=A0ABU1CH61_9GAMM|nr:DNA-processing protein DprA [Lysobacter arvi]MDR0184293.1 DNA-processing protein DprA [Lysobacter arvi]